MLTLASVNEWKSTVQLKKWILLKVKRSVIETSKSVKTCMSDMMSVTTDGHCITLFHDNDIGKMLHEPHIKLRRILVVYCTHPGRVSSMSLVSPLLIHLVISSTSVVSWPLLLSTTPPVSVMPVWWWTRLSVMPIWWTILSIMPVWRWPRLKEMILISWLMARVCVHVQWSSLSVRPGAASAHASDFSLLTWTDRM